MTIIDQINQSIKLKSTPQRIVSLVPSLTELLVDLGLESQIVGITKFCVHPDHLKDNCTIIGGTKNVNIEKVKSLKPDLIIANKEENEKSQVDAVSKICPVFTTDITVYEDVISLINSLNEIFDLDHPNKLIQQISDSIPKRTFNNETVLYLIWKRPYMSIGNDTFIHQNLSLLGLNNICIEQKRYPIVELKDIESPDLIFLSSEPYPFKEVDKEEFRLLFPNSKVFNVDGEAFSWYGSRLSNMSDYFSQLNTEVYASV